MLVFESPVQSYRLINKEEAVDTSECIKVTDVKLPSDTPARMKVLRADGKKWYLTIVYHEDTSQPFALFCHTNSHDKSTQTSDAVTRLIALARKKGILEEHIETTEAKCKKESNVGQLTRTISLLLRHGVLIKNIVAELNKMEDIFAGSFLFQIKKFLTQYIKDGESADVTCSNCKSDRVVFIEGCHKCLDCDHSGCS